MDAPAFPRWIWQLKSRVQGPTRFKVNILAPDTRPFWGGFNEGFKVCSCDQPSNIMATLATLATPGR